MAEQGPKRRRGPAVYLCGWPTPVHAEQCPAGGRDHDPIPPGYLQHADYAAQLLSTGWTQHRCPACGRWRLWRPDQPQPQPPMRPQLVDTGQCADCGHAHRGGACPETFERAGPCGCETYELTEQPWGIPPELEGAGCEACQDGDPAHLAALVSA